MTDKPAIFPTGFLFCQSVHDAGAVKQLFQKKNPVLEKTGYL